MSQRHFIAASIGTRPHIALICLFLFIAGAQNVHPQSQIARDVFAIFEGSCLICHGPDGAYRETLLMEHTELIEGGTVIPGNPDASELYKRLLGTTENGGAQMPLGQPPLPPQSIEAIRRWILAGAPDWTAAPITTRRFIPPSEVLKAIDAHVKTISPFDRPFARYFTMTHLYNAGVAADIFEEYLKALAKLVNSLSWGLDIVNPTPIDREETIFYIDLRHYEWDRNDGWTKIEEAYPYYVGFNAPAQRSLKNQLSQLQTTLTTAVPSVNIDWFIATAAAPPLYNALLSLPGTDRELETRLEVDVVNNILTAPGIRVWRAGFNNSGVSNHNRVVERHASRYGAYWKSYDFAGSVGKQNIFTHPLAFTHNGGEVIFNLPNGLQGYYLVDGDGFRLDEAPISIVSNPAASDPTVRNGLSCIGCHTEGMKEVTDQVRSVIESDTNPAYNKAHALQLYVADSTMDSKVNDDLVRYQRALTATGNAITDVEPVSRFHEAFHSPLDLSFAAAAVGLEPSVFLSKIRENAGLQSAGLLVLDGGQIKRDTWTSSFDDVISALDFPTSIGDTPVVDRPDLLPGAPIDIPDSNLRAVIAETLGVKTIRADDMAKLTVLRANDKNISNLTGLEFARNLEELWIKDNPLRDLSPIAKCTNLKILGTQGTPILDFSPLTGLTKLEWLWLQVNSSAKDISALAGLTNLRELVFYGGDVVDISALANLRELRRLTFKHNAVVDVSPIANMTKLEFLSLHNNQIVDISPLAGLTKLRDAELSHNRISGLSPLSMLTNLTDLNLKDNKISDVSPLAGLTKLVSLLAHHNEISDVSPLAGLTNLGRLLLDNNKISNVSPLSRLINLEYLDVSSNLLNNITPLASIKNLVLAWSDNPGFTGGPKIEGPWLWIYLPHVTLEDSFDTDFLSEATGGKVTEVGVATDGATEGNPVGDEVWTSHKLPTTGRNNFHDMLGRTLPRGLIYGNIYFYSPEEQDTTMYLGAHQRVKVWLNGELIYQRNRLQGGEENYTEFFSLTLHQGRNVLLIASDFRIEEASNGFFGFDSGTKYTLEPPGIGYAFSQSPIHIGDTFEFDVRAENVSDLAGWQFDIAFDSSILEALDVSEGDFLKTDGGTTFFQSGRIDNAAGKITGLIAGRISEGGVSGSGSVLQVRFKAKSEGETELALRNFEFGSSTGENIPAGPLEIRIAVEERLATGDVNRDGRVSILDLILVAQQLGKRVSEDSAVDINGDGVVNIFDLTLVAQGIGTSTAAAPAGATRRVDAATIEAWIAGARLADDGSIAFRQGIQNLQNLLASLFIPQETALLANYPNPFNPETWIPYQLAVPAEITLTIYDMNGVTVRRLEMGHQPAGLYQRRSRAVYWDGRNQRGESVASGLYFYTLRTGDFTATRKMLIRK